MDIQLEKEHIKLLKQSNVKSFEWLYLQYNKKLFGFIYKVSNGDIYLCEEIVQDVFVKIWEQKEHIDPDKSFSSFLCTIAKNKLSNLYQHRILESLYKEYVERNSMIQQFVNQEDEVSVVFLRDYIDSLIDQLPPARKKILRMSRFDNLSNQVISEKLNISKNAVELQVSRALAFLRKQLSGNRQNIITVIVVCLFNQAF